MSRVEQMPKSIEAMVSARAAARLRAFRRNVELAFQGQLNDVLLFGSRARGDAKLGSDYDVAVLFSGTQRTPELRRILSDIAYPFVRAGTPIRPIAIFADEVGGPGPMPIANSISRDGIVIF